jgi:type IV pilus assembly protein PilC
MPQFLCKVGTPSGEIVQRVYSAADEAALRSQLGAEDLLVLSLRRQGALGSLVPRFGKKSRRRVSGKEFLVFNQELLALVKAGLPIINCLEILIERRKNPVFKQVLSDVRDQVRAGTSLSEAFESHGDLFPSIYSPSLASGERSGEVASVLERYVKYSKTVTALRKKVVSALVYPALLLLLSLGLISVLILYVLPKFAEFFEGMEAELPLLTVVLVGASTFLRDQILFLVAIFVAAGVAFTAWKRTPAGEVQLDRIKMSLPMVGKVWHLYAVSRFCRTLGTLLAGGIPLVTALEIAGKGVGVRLFTERTRDVMGKVREGQSLWESLEKTGTFTDMTVEMIRVGEETGALETMLLNVADFYDEEIESDLQTLISLMEPLLLIFMGIVIATILLSIYLPLFKSFSATQG